MGRSEQRAQNPIHPGALPFYRRQSQRVLPGALDLKGDERFGLAFIEDMFDNAIDTAAARAEFETGAQLIEIGRVSGRDDFYIALLSVAHPTAQLELAGLPMNEPAKANPLHAPLNLEMNDHGLQPLPVLQSWCRPRNLRPREQAVQSISP